MRAFPTLIALLLAGTAMAAEPARKPTPVSYTGQMERGNAAMDTNMVGIALSELLVPARAGDARAQYMVGRIYTDRIEVDGQGISRNSVQGVAWITASANQGHIPAIRRLIEIYDSGVGMPADSIKAKHWREVLAKRLTPPAPPPPPPSPDMLGKIDWQDKDRIVLNIAPGADTKRLGQQLKEILQQRRIDAYGPDAG